LRLRQQRFELSEPRDAPRSSSELFRSSSQLFDSATQEARIAYLEAITDDEREQLDVLDSAFFEYPDDLTDLLFGYVASNQEIFGPLPNEIDVE